MRFHMPTEIYNESGCVRNHAGLFKSLGEKALIVTGAHSSKVNGSLDDVQSALENQGISFLVFDGIEENPSVETCAKAAKLGIEEKVDFVIGIGGGSPLDASKAIALLIKNPQLDSSVFYKKIPLEALPVIAIPTTAGTGSEATPYAILTIHEQQTKQSISHRIFPKAALIDPGYFKFMPEKVMIYTAVDALAHLIESYLSTTSHKCFEFITLEGISLWKKAMAPYLNVSWDNSPLDLSDKQRRDEMLAHVDYESLVNASTLAGICISQTGTSLPHGMSYPVTYEHKLAHGCAVAIFLPSYIKRYEDTNRVNHLLKRLGMENQPDKFAAFINYLLGKPKAALAQVEKYAQVMAGNVAKSAHHPYPVSYEMYLDMYKESMDIE